MIPLFQASYLFSIFSRLAPNLPGPVSILIIMGPVITLPEEKNPFPVTYIRVEGFDYVVDVLIEDMFVHATIGRDHHI